MRADAARRPTLALCAAALLPACGRLPPPDCDDPVGRGVIESLLVDAAEPSGGVWRRSLQVKPNSEKYLEFEIGGVVSAPGPGPSGMFLRADHERQTMQAPDYTLIDLAGTLERFRERLGHPFPTLQAVLDLCERRMPERWTPVPHWEALDDAGLYRRLTATAAPRGALLAVSEAAYGAGGGFALEAAAMPAFLERHAADFGESLFNGDLLVLGLDQARVWLFHHEGAAASFSASELREPAR